MVNRENFYCRIGKGGATVQTRDEIIYAVATDEERDALQQLEAALQQDIPQKMVDAQGKEITIPTTLLSVFQQVVAHIANQKPMLLQPRVETVSISEAANILNCSEMYVKKLLDEGKLPYSGVGDQRCVRMDDLLAFDAQAHVQQREALDELTRMSEDFGLYDE
jgi:excisionase family DNA binding protein